MRGMITASRAALTLLVCAAAVPSAAQDQYPAPTAVWAPKPTQTTPYPPSHKPWV